jgi:hypothetical protein
VNESDREAQQQTWCSTLPKNISVFWIRGHNSSEYRLNGVDLYVPCLEGYENILAKTILAVAWCIKNLPFEMLIRTNVSTYYSIPHLIKDLEKFDPTKALFGGFFDESRSLRFPKQETFSFVTGTGIYLTQPACRVLMNLKPENFVTIPDDVAISYFLMQQGLNPFFFRRVNMHSTHIFILGSQIRLKSSEISNLARKRFLLIFQYSLMPRSIRKIICYLRIELQEIANLQLTRSHLGSFVRRNSHIFYQNIKYFEFSKDRGSK